MEVAYFSHNGTILPVEQAVIPLANIEYSYGYGVYETIRVSGGVIYFVDDHIKRLLESARIIELEHMFSANSITQNIQELVKKNAIKACNVKMLLIGGKSASEAQLIIQCLHPLFPDRKLYKTGAHFVTYKYERLFPHAKSLNMLPSYLAYRKAKAGNAYDALLINNHGNIVEGTRTNFFCMKDTTIISPPESQILLGVMRKAVLRVAAANGFDILERDISLQNLSEFEAAFVTSTSSKIMPVRTIDDHSFGEPAENLKRLMSKLNEFLENSNGKLY